MTPRALALLLVAAIENLFVGSFRGGEADAEAAFAPAIDACT